MNEVALLRPWLPQMNTCRLISPRGHKHQAVSSRRNAGCFKLRTRLACMKASHDEGISQPLMSLTRRQQLLLSGGSCMACLCGACSFSQNNKKRFFAWSMQNVMGEYEDAIRATKEDLFSELSSSLLSLQTSQSRSTGIPLRILEIGFGTGSNLPYLSSFASASSSRSVDLIGLDPNEDMFGYARGNALKSGFSLKDTNDQQLPSTSSSSSSSNLSLTLIKGDSQQLPLPDSSFDAAVCTLVLCSVKDPARSLSELSRVLKPGSPLLFIEHVLAPTDDGLVRFGQTFLNPLQGALADGCSLVRDTGEVIRSSNGFLSSDEEQKGWARNIPGLGLLSPHIAGIVKTSSN